MLQLDMKTASARHLGKDRLLSLIHVAPSFIIGVWRVIMYINVYDGCDGYDLIV